MADLTLQEAATELGMAYANLRKDAQRGKIILNRDGSRPMVSREALDAYRSARGLEKAAKAVEQGRPREAGNIIAQLPGAILGAILEGMPQTGGKGAHLATPAPFLKAIEGAPRQTPIDLSGSDDPHFGFPVGYQHKVSPRWKRISASTWQLGTASWGWNGLFWEGGGAVAGRQLGEGIAPSSPDAGMRPLSPAKADAK